MSSATGADDPKGRVVTAEERVSLAADLIEIIEREIPERYQLELFRVLAEGLLAEATPLVPSPMAATGPRLRGAATDWSQIELGVYAPALAGPGRLLVKSLVVLAVMSEQMAVDWMTPAEVERFLSERVRAPKVYRTNISNALRDARGLVDRRPRGRAFEYKLSDAGRAYVTREVAIRSR